MTRDGPETGWELHPQIASDCLFAKDLPLSRLLILRDAAYPWLLLVPRRAGAREWFEIGAAERVQLAEEIALTGRVLKRISGCDKINIGALGNIVPQLHIHVVARRSGDPAWPGPVWGHGPMTPYDPAALQAFRARLEKEMALA